MGKQTEILENIFNNILGESRVFRNRDALRHDYIPDYLPHREEEIRVLGQILGPSLRGTPCSNVLIYGKTGTGKTAVTKFVLKQLAAKAEEIESPLKVSFVNCRLAGTEYRILSALCSSIDVKVPFTGLALGEVFDRFKSALDSEKIVLVVALDEIDALIKERGDILLYELTRINESLGKSKVSMLGISNDLRFKEMLDPRVLSTLSEEEIVFRPYNAEELRDILEQRAKIAFKEGVSVDVAIKLCSAIAAAEHGDARRALDLLRVSAELAEREGKDFISEDHVYQAQKRIEHDRVVEALRSLPTHSKIVLLSIFLLSRSKARGFMTGDIYNVYCELCEEMGLSPLTQRRVSGLINELDVIGLVNSRVVSLGRYGRSKKTMLGVPSRIIKDVLIRDERLGSMINYAPKYLVSLR
ncbi:MAG: cell division control protein Cdc6 [Candidatus Bathyarchaeota archaeon B63]|nr:MAG: cell division control protein Cdc6 [Candidatus Bathyarchaeota archaeon B63]